MSFPDFPAPASPLGAALPPAPARPLRLALVEDDPTIRELLHRYLGACPEFDCVIIADSSEMLWRELALSLPPQLLLLDLSLPGQSGLEALPALLARFPELQVLVQTSNDAADVIYQALRLGARGFVVKSATPLPAYRQALLDVAAGGAVMSPSVARKMLTHFTPVAAQQPQLLSERERQVLEGLVAGRTEKQVAEQLGIGAATVRTYVVRLYDKLRVANKAELLARAARGIL
jgi:DNA-binding NarL/FixJ family response regulator